MRKLFAWFLSSALLAWLSWIVVLFAFDPFVGGVVVRGLFLAALGLAVCESVFTLLLWLETLQAHVPRFLRETVYRRLRYAFWCALGLTMILELAAHRLLNWWNTLLLVALMITLELFLRSLARPYRRPQPVRANPETCAYETKPTP